jgi:hypothetical protein
MGIPASPSFFNLLRNYNPITKITTPQLKQAFSGYGDQVLSQFERYYKAVNSNNPIEQLGNFYAQIDKELASERGDIPIASG